MTDYRITDTQFVKLMSLVGRSKQKELTTRLWEDHRISRYDRNQIKLVRKGWLKPQNVIPLTPITKLIRSGWVNLDVLWFPGAIIRPDFVNSGGMAVLRQLQNASHKITEI